MMNYYKKSTFQFLETIAIEEGEALHLPYHQARIERTFKQFFPQSSPFDLTTHLERALHHFLEAGNHLKGSIRCRLLYSEIIEEIQFIPYQIRPVEYFKLVEADHLEYHYKYADRSAIDTLFKEAKSDEIILTKEGKISDTSIANLAFFNGKEWITPKTPLLKGTARARLLDEGRIIEGEISLERLKTFHLFTDFNAMIPFKRRLFPIDAIINIEK